MVVLVDVVVVGTVVNAVVLVIEESVEVDVVEEMVEDAVDVDVEMLVWHDWQGTPPPDWTMPPPFGMAVVELITFTMTFTAFAESDTWSVTITL